VFVRECVSSDGKTTSSPSSTTWRRTAWWRRIGGTSLPSSPSLDDAPIWKRILEDSRNVVLWDGPHPSEHLYAIRGCWFLRQTPHRVYEVKLPAHEDDDLPAFYGAIGIVGPNGVAAAWPTLRLVPPADVEARAEEWVELQRQSRDGFRDLRAGRIVELPITAHDDALIDACSDGWTSSTLVVADVLSKEPRGDMVLAWRVRELIEEAKLEGRGDMTGLGLPNEIRRVV